MPNLHGNLPQSELARYHAGNRLRSPIDADNVCRQWERGDKVAVSLEGLLQQVRFLQQQLNRMRKGHGGGDVQPSSSLVVFEHAADLTDVLQSDYVKAYKVKTDGTADTGTTYKIAKPWRLRGSVSEEIIGTITYNYTYGPKWVTRTVSWLDGVTTNYEYQIIVPPWVDGQYILATQLPYTGVNDEVSGKDVGWLDTNVHAMAWMRQSS